LNQRIKKKECSKWDNRGGGHDVFSVKEKKWDLRKVMRVLGTLFASYLYEKRFELKLLARWALLAGTCLFAYCLFMPVLIWFAFKKSRESRVERRRNKK